MSDNQTSSAAKFTALDAAQTNGKQAVLAADSFAMNQNGIQGVVEKHSQAIETMQENYYSLEQQVKSMSRIMATQNIPKLSENLKLAQEDLRRSLLYQMSEKHKDLMTTVEREVNEVSDAKIGLLKKIDTVEQHILTVVGAKLDEAAQSRKDNAEKIDKLENFMESVPSIADKTNAIIKQLENKLSEMKGEFRVFKAGQSQADREQDKTTQLLTSEVRTALEAAKDKIAEETKSLSKLIHKREQLLCEELKDVRELVEKEGSDRGDSYKTMQKFVKDEVDKVKVYAEKKFIAMEGSQDLKVKPCIAALKEMKRAIDEEACHRDTADKDLARRIAKEVQERHQDEERLVTLIGTCQEAVGKLHRA